MSFGKFCLFALILGLVALLCVVYLPSLSFNKLNPVSSVNVSKDTKGNINVNSDLDNMHLKFSVADVEKFLDDNNNKFGEISFYSHIPDGKGNFLKVPSCPMPSAVVRIMETSDSSLYATRCNDADCLGDSLNENEIQALILFLHKKLDDDHLPTLEFNAVKNQVALALIRQKSDVQALVPHLLALFYNSRMDDVWRSYCLQFLGQTYNGIQKQIVKDAVVYTLFESLDDENQSFAGTALLALDSLVNEYHCKFKPLLAEKAALSAENIDSHPNLKMTALQIAVKNGSIKTPRLAAKILRSKKNYPVMLKVSALAALAQSGNSKYLKIIKKHFRDYDKRIQCAAKSAYGKLLNNKS